jgi:TonB-dependent receptor
MEKWELIMIKLLKVLVLFQIIFVLQLFAQNDLQSVELNAENLKNVPLELLNNVSLHIEDASFEVALNEIAQKGDIQLNYNRNSLPLEAEVSVDIENGKTIEVLLAILEQTSTKLQITKSGTLIIVPIEKDEIKGKIKGTVIDANSGEALIGANIMIKGTSIGTAANIDGEFILPSVKPGEYTLKITYVGYKEKTERVTVVSNRATKVVVKLEWVAVEGKTVLVTAQAKGQLSAINEQLSADEIKNVVSKDRIRELPDQNAAESVGRLPGVSLLRSGGEGNRVVIRGMQPKYSKIMVDGVSLTPTGSNDRSVSMGMISSYSLEGIEVIKSPTANMDGDQIGGSVNFVMKTAPEGFNYEIVAQGGYNNLRKSFNDYMILGSISNRFFDNKLGVFAQISADQKNMGSNSMSASYYMKSEDPDKLNDLGINGVNLTNIFRDRNRYGGTLTLDYLIPNGKIYFKNFLSSGKTVTQTYNEGFNSRVHSFTTSDRESKELIYSNILSYEQDISIFKIKAKLSHSYSGSDVPNDIRFDFKHLTDVNAFSPDISPEEIPSYANNEFEKVIWTSFKDGESYTDGRQIMGKIDFSTDFALSNQINGKLTFGGKFRYDEHSYDYDGFQGNPVSESSKDYKNLLIDKIPQFGGVDKNSSTFYYPLFFDNNFSHGEFINGKYTPGPVADIAMLHNILDVMRGYFHEKENADFKGVDGIYYHMAKSSVIKDYTGIERLGAGYMMVELNITDKIKFIPGIRYEAKTTTYNGVFGHSGSKPEYVYTPTDTSTTRNNDFWLPMIHLRYEPLNWLQIRVAYTQTIARPDFRHILPNMDIDPRLGLTMNNPYLRPELSENFDLYFSFTENHLGLFSIGGFWKNIDDKIFSQGGRVLLDPEEYNLDPKYEGFTFDTQDNNPETSVVKGFEIDWQTNFWYLPSFLSGIVLNVNYTKIFSEAKYPKSRIEQRVNPAPPPRRISVNIDESYWDRLLNQPNDIVNIALGYDYKGFSGRLSMNYSSNIFVSTNFWQEYRRLTDDYLRWDLSLTQKLPWKGFQLYCNITNLGQAMEQDHLFGGSKPKSMKYYGSAVYLGIRWRSE